MEAAEVRGARVLALLAAGCPGGSSTTAATTTHNGGFAYSRCMRFHGVPNFPDPNSSGMLPEETAQQPGVSDSQLRAAGSACGQLNPN